MGAKHLTVEERKEAYKCFDAGMTLKETAQRIGRSRAAVIYLKADWRDSKNNSIEIEPIVEQAKEEPTIANSDYAKAYLSGDPRWANGSLTVKKVITVDSEKTGFRYRMTAGNDNISIVTPDGKSIEIPRGIFEAFSNEIVDVYIEMMEFEKK